MGHDDFTNSVKIPGVCVVLEEHGWWHRLRAITRRKAPVTIGKLAAYRRRNKTVRAWRHRPLQGSHHLFPSPSMAQTPFP